jgi:hypothetical protein
MQLHKRAVLRKQRRSKRSNDVKAYKLRVNYKIQFINFNNLIFINTVV